jgi:hypothetical protein
MFALRRRWHYNLPVMTFFRSFLLFLLLVLALVSAAPAQDVFKSTSVFVDLVFGEAELTDKNGKKRKISNDSESTVFLPVRIREGESIQTGANADCNLVLPNAGTAKLSPSSRVKIPTGEAAASKKASSLELLGGKLFLSIDGATLTRKKKQFRLKTPTTILAVKGTQFFADAQTETETSGVHKGKVVILELNSGKFVTLNQGNAVMAKPGALAKPRRLTREEIKLSEIYRSFEVQFIPAERDRRKFEASYGAQEDPNSAISTDYPRLIKATKTEELENSAVKITFQAYPKAKDISVHATTRFETPVRLKSAPKVIYFLARGDGVRGFQLSGVLEARKKKYSPLLPDSNVIQFPKGTKPGEWVPFLVPLKETQYTQNEGTIGLSVNPNLTEDRAVPSVVMVDKDKPEYHLEISPFMIGVTPGK